MPWIPSEEGERPTLGYYVIDWMIENLQMPDTSDVKPFTPYVEQEDFILEWYALDPITGKRLYNSGVYSRSRGVGKSPFLGALAIVEALADVVPDGWDAYGPPVERSVAAYQTPAVEPPCVPL